LGQWYWVNDIGTQIFRPLYWYTPLDTILP
jgi:hypothetical protein